jgi:hypothetical protein
VKGGKNDAKAYLSESVLVQNSLLEPRYPSAGVRSQGGSTGGSGEGAVTKGPGRETLGDGIFGLRGAPATAPNR